MSYRWMETFLIEYVQFLETEEKSTGTIKKYRRDIEEFSRFLDGRDEVSRELVLEFKRTLTERYASSTVNSKLAALNSFFHYQGWDSLRVKFLKIQASVFREAEKDLSRAEYLRLLQVARSQGKIQLALIMETIGATGIRIGELPFITVESIRSGRTEVSNKGKRRIVFLPRKLRDRLLQFCRRQGIRTGTIFLSSRGNPVDRSNLWKEMKTLCRVSGVLPEKVFPHNLRHLFAKVFYAQNKDIAKLADLLGHGSIQTTRIYLMETGTAHEKLIERMGLLL